MSRTGRVAIRGAVVLAAIVAGRVAFGFFAVGYFNDDACYLNQALQFARSGDLLHAAGDPRHGLAARLPGFPLLLSPFALVSGGNIDVLRLICLAVSALGCLLFARLADDAELDWPLATLVGAAFLFNPTGLVYASTFMSDAWFAVASAAALVAAEAMTRPRPKTAQVDVEDAPPPPSRGAQRRRQNAARTQTTASPAAALGLGILLGLCVLIRISGGVTDLAVILLLTMRRQFRAAVLATIASASIVGGYLLIKAHLASASVYYLPQISEYYRNSPNSITTQLGLWAITFLTIIGHEFLGFHERHAAWIALPLLLLALVGFIRLWRARGATAIGLFVPAYLGSLLIWPYLLARYLLPLWPPLLVFTAWALPQKARLPAVAGLILISLPTLYGELSYSVSPRPDAYPSYTWIRDNSRAGEIVSATYEGTAHLRTGLDAVSMPSTHRPAELLAALVQQHVTWIILEPASEAIVDVGGGAQFAQPLAIDQWLDHSTLATRAHATEHDRVYRLTVDPARYTSAFDHYVRGATLAGSNPQAAERELRTALVEIPDFPEVKSTLAIVLLAQNPQSTEAVSLLQNVIAQYPTDLEAAINLGMALDAQGRKQQAAEVRKTAAATARTLGPQAAPLLQMLAP